MSLDRRGIKQRAREIIASSKPRVLTVGMVFLLLSIVVELLGQRVLSVNVSESEAMNYMNYVSEGNYEYALKYLDGMTPPTSAYLIHILLSLTMSVVRAGFLIFLLNTVRGNAPAFGNLLDAFGFFPKVIVLNILKAMLVFLWSLLLFFPGVIAHYRYSQAIYLLIDDPTKSPVQCLRESRLLMNGHKAELFELDLSFIGWYLLAAFPTFGYAVQFWSTPYIATTKTLYYDRLVGRRAAQTVTASE
ncbi:MAG: DUF975 family protein [Oscillospiraceae bacterium]|nr:DUF975 family protein [Oscillospiraceae bacterium]